MKKLAVALVALFVCVSTTFAQEMEKAQEKYTEAIEKVKAADLTTGISLLKEAMGLAIDAGDEGLDLVKETQGLLPKLYMQLGVQQVKAQKMDEAIVSLLAAEEMADLYNDNNTRRQASRIISGLYMNKGAELFNNKDYAGALEIFKKGYEQDDSNIKLATFVAKTYAELGQLDQAVPLFNKIIETGAANSKYAADAQSAQADLDQYVLVAVSDAVTGGDLVKAVEMANLVPASAQAALLVMQGANNAKKYDVVIERGDAAVNLQTDPALKSDVYYFIGSAYNSKENKAKAIEYLSKVSAGQFAAAAKTAVAELKK